MTGKLQNNKPTWKIFKGNDASWNLALDDFPFKGYLNTIHWGMHLSNLGWEPLRFEFSGLSRPTAYCKIFIKSYPFGVGVVFIPDGIIGDYKHLSSLQHDLTRILKLRFCYVRLRESKAFHADDYVKFLVEGWERPGYCLATGLTMTLDISDSMEHIKSGFSKNWRKILKKSSKMPFDIVEVREVKSIAKLYLELRKSKGLSVNQIYSEDYIKSLVETHDDNLIVLGARDLNGNLVSIRGAICHKSNATDIVAATSPAGRSLSASHPVLFDLLKYCKSKGCISYDLNGIDPSSSVGVYNFKRGTGSQAKAALGEFEWSNSNWLKWAINLFVKYR